MFYQGNQENIQVLMQKTAYKNHKLLQSWDKSYVWHPFTQMKEWDEKDILVIEKGKGVYLYDTQGNKYIDGVSSLWVNVHGHNHPVLNKALAFQAGRLAHSTLLGLANDASILLARELIRISPKSLHKVFYSDSGSTAVEVALKMAYQYWNHKGQKRKTFLVFENGYHGDTIGSVSVGGIELFHELFRPLLFSTLKTPWPHTYWRGKGMTVKAWTKYCLQAFESTLKKHRHEIAAVIMEPVIQGASGMSLSPSGFLKAVADLCKRYGTLLIIDEVATGFGRSGKMFACEWEGVKPDIMCVAKGITGGYLPLAATLTSNDIYEAFLGDYTEFKTFFHGHTYTGNPLACRVALENIKLFQKNKLLNKVRANTALLKRELETLKHVPHVGDIRQFGMMAGIELVRDVHRQIPFELKEKVGMRVCRMARNFGVIIRPLGNVIVLMPPLSISKTQLTQLVSAVKKSIEAVLKEMQYVV